jgi:hypothetical protein
LLATDVAMCIANSRQALLHGGWDMFDVAVTPISSAPDLGMLSAS